MNITSSTLRIFPSAAAPTELPPETSVEWEERVKLFGGSGDE